MNKMTPEQKVKLLILLKNAEWNKEELPEITSENIDSIYDETDGDDYDLTDACNDIRGGDVETKIDTPYSRYYESKSVAAKLPDGSWVGWTYWYGGGKHGEPSSIDWMDEAYDLDCKEEEKTLIVREFTRKP